MALVPARCVPSDAPAVAEACVSTFERMPRHQTSYGKVPRDRQVEYFTRMFARGIESQAHPTSTLENHFLKVGDPVTGDIMAFAIWMWLPQGYRLEEDEFASPQEMLEGSNQEFIIDFARRTGELRGEHEGRRGPHWLLELLGTHPRYERRGAAGALIRWPFDQADKECMKCYVDASSVGYALYSRCGFKDVGEIIADLERWEGGEGKGKVKWVAMLREPEMS